jgi:hypothetical protein
MVSGSASKQTAPAGCGGSGVHQGVDGLEALEERPQLQGAQLGLRQLLERRAPERLAILLHQELRRATSRRRG